MKIGVMLRHLGERGGIQVYTTNLLEALLNIDDTNQYVLIYKDPKNLGRFSRFTNAVEKVVYSPNKLWWDQISVPHIARKEGLDLIYNPKLSVPLFTRCNTILVMHGAGQFAVPHSFTWHDRIYFTIANRLYCKKASAIITGTHIGADGIVRYMGAHRKKIHVIPDSYKEHCRVVEEREKQRVKTKYSLPESFILFLGGIEPKKNLRNMLIAYSQITNSFAHKLLLVGFVRWKYARDLELVDQLGLRDRVIFTGFVPDEDIPAIYNLADLFLFPSLYEGFGMPVLEAMACGCPVITTQTGCTPEVAGDAAILVDPYDPTAIAEATRKVLTDETLRRQLRERGFARARRFSWQQCAKETLALFESVVGTSQ